VEESRLTFKFDVGEYHCVARALSIGEWESIQGRALPLLTTELQEEVILACLIEPEELKQVIIQGDIQVGIPLYVYETIIEHSGFFISVPDREAVMEEARAELSMNLVDGLRAIVIAANVATLKEMDSLNMWDLFRLTALAERVIDIRQQNQIGALQGGDPLLVRWEVKEDDASQKAEELKAKMAAKGDEIAQSLAEQTAMRPGRGMVRMAPDNLKTTR
jgi:hypothetical protein